MKKHPIIQSIVSAVYTVSVIALGVYIGGIGLSQSIELVEVTHR